MNEINKPDSETGIETRHEANVSKNLDYNDDNHEPELHARTYSAIAAMFLLNMVQVLALQGPPAVVSISLLSFSFKVN